MSLIKYKELVANISAHPDYTKALIAVKNIASEYKADDSASDLLPASKK